MVRRLVYANLTAAAVIAGVGIYAYSLTATRRVRVSGTSHSWVDRSGVVHVAATDVWLTSVIHPHAAWAYAAWVVALVVCLISVGRLRTGRR